MPDFGPAIPEPAAATQPRPMEAAVSHLLDRLGRRLDGGSLRVVFPSGSTHEISAHAPGVAARVNIHNRRLIRRIALFGALGVADSYVDGDWDSEDLTATLEFCARNLGRGPRHARPDAAMRAAARVIHARRANTRAGSRRNIMAHYDLGNEFYRAWLGPTMAYSAAMFAAPDQSLDDAQTRKFDRLAQAIDLQPGDRLLEIGCGWGGFAMHAARKYGARVTALTVSPAQADWATARVAEAGLSDRIAVRLQDYRDVGETFDRIASIEMFEAVGERYWPVFFSTVGDRLRSGGRAGLQVITIAHDRFDSYRRNPDFIQLRVFPGGMLPSVPAFADQVARAGFALRETRSFGADYAETLRRWRLAFEGCWHEIAPFGFDDRFRRFWRYYLCYCEAGFRAGSVSVEHFTLARP